MSDFTLSHGCQLANRTVERTKIWERKHEAQGKEKGDGEGGLEER